MALSSAFSQQGPVKQTPMLPGLGGGAAPQTAYSKALSGSALPTPVMSLGNSLPKAPSAPTNQPVKSYTQKANGDVSVAYHPDTSKPASAQTSGLMGAGTGSIIPTGGNPGTPNTPVTPQPSSTPPAPTPTTFPGMLGSVASQGAQPSSLTQNAGALAQQAATGVAGLQKDIAASKIGAAERLADLGSSPVAGSSQMGLAGVISGKATAEQQALASEAQALSNLYSPAIGAATTGQGQQFGAAQSAAGLAQPSTAAVGQTTFNPLTGKYEGGVGGLDESTMATYASLLAQGAGSQIPASIMGNAALSAQLQTMAKQINPSYNPVTTPASAAATAQNVTALGTAGTAGVAAAQSAQQQQVQQWTSSLQQARNLGSQLTDLITSFGLNPNDINVANVGLQKIASNTSDPRYQALNSYVADLANTYAQVLTPPGGSTTDMARSISAGLLDGTAKGQSIITQMQVLDNQAQAKISGVPTSATQATNTGNSGGALTWDTL
jgi:hypothetical protein